MSRAKQGDTVRIHYTGRLTDGKVIGSSRERNPVELTIGAGQVITGVEQALEGMAPGESKSVHIPAAEGFGPRQDSMIMEFERSQLPPDIDPRVGQQVQLHTQDSDSMPAVVTGVSETTVTVDANHPLAGEELIFDIELMELVGA